jgi:hypothetical protein
MHRIDTAHRDVDLFGSGKDGFTNGTPGGDSPTETDADHFNALQEELCGVVESVGNVLDKDDNGQVLQAFEALQQLALMRTMWTVRTHGANETVWGAAFSTDDYLFVLVGSSTGASPYIITSNDGRTWTARTEATAVDLYAVNFCPLGFVAVGAASGGKSYIVVSTAGTSWAKATTVPSLSFPLYGVAARNSSTLWAAVGGTTGAGGPHILSATNRNTWTARAMATPVDGDLYCVAHNQLAGADGLFVAAGKETGAGPAILITSTDAITWTTRDIGTGTAFDPAAVAHNGRTGAAGLWVVVGDTTSGSSNARTSPDGITWTPRTIVHGDYLWEAVAFVNGVWVAAGQVDGDMPVMATSLDGITWVRSYPGGAENLRALAVSEEMVIAGGDGTGASPTILQSTGRII